MHLNFHIYISCIISLKTCQQTILQTSGWIEKQLPNCEQMASKRITRPRSEMSGLVIGSGWFSFAAWEIGGLINIALWCFLWFWLKAFRFQRNVIFRGVILHVGVWKLFRRYPGGWTGRDAIWWPCRGRGRECLMVRESKRRTSISFPSIKVLQIGTLLAVWRWKSDVVGG